MNDTDKLVPSADAVSVFLDGSRGSNLPRDFIRIADTEAWDGIHEMDIEALEFGPDHDGYWDTWDSVLYCATYTDCKGNKWTLHQDGDLFLICHDLMTDDEYIDLFGELPNGEMTSEEVQEDFKENILPMVLDTYDADDEIAINEAFNDYTDSLCQTGKITDWLYNNIEYEG